MKDAVRVGLVGSGFISSIHAESLRHCAHAELEAIASPTTDHAQSFARTHNIPHHYQDYRKMLEGICLLLGSAITPSVAHAVLAGYRAPLQDQSLRALTVKQNELIATLTEVIIPATDTPGARGARVDAFIDGLLTDIFTAEERTRFLAGLADVDARAEAEHDSAFLDCTANQQVAILANLEREAE